LHDGIEAVESKHEPQLL